MSGTSQMSRDFADLRGPRRSPWSDHLLVVANFWTPVTKLVYYYHVDELGSVRAVTDSAGAVVEQHDYRPFGEDNQPLPTEGADPARFLGQERDQTKLDVFGARYYSMFRGRFNTVDPGHSDASLLVPQRWNAYAYGRNNPLRFSDPAGLKPGCDLPPGSYCGDDSIPPPDGSAWLPGTPNTGGGCGFATPHSFRTQSSIGAGNCLPSSGLGGIDIVTVLTTGLVPVPPPPPPGPPSAPPVPPVPPLIDRLKGLIPSVCSGGSFLYGAAEFKAPFLPAKIEDIGIVEYDTHDGGSHGGVLAAVAGSSAIGFEAMRTWSDWETHYGPIALNGAPLKSASKAFQQPVAAGKAEAGYLLNFMNGQLNVGGYFGTEMFGGGSYVSVSWNGCHQ